MASVSERVIDIVAEQLGVSKDQIQNETSFVNDLGAASAGSGRCWSMPERPSRRYR